MLFIVGKSSRERKRERGTFDRNIHRDSHSEAVHIVQQRKMGRRGKRWRRRRNIVGWEDTVDWWKNCPAQPWTSVPADGNE